MSERADRVMKLIEEALSDARLPWWEWDIEANRVTFNELKVTMLGYSMEDFRECGYQAFTELLHPQDYERTMQAMRDHLEGRLPIYEIDYRIRRADDTYTWYMDRGCTIERDEKGRPLRLRGIVLDLGPAFSQAAAHHKIVEAVRRSLPSGGNEAVVPLCSVCLRFRADERNWLPLDREVIDRFHANASHGICPDCVRTLYPEDADAILRDLTR